MADTPEGTIKAKTTAFGNPVKDVAGEPVKTVSTPEGGNYEVKTKSTAFGNPVKDAAGENVKTITKKN
jgi:uncharacterized protein (UPF0305 family)